MGRRIFVFLELDPYWLLRMVWLDLLPALQNALLNLIVSFSPFSVIFARMHMSVFGVFHRNQSKTSFSVRVNLFCLLGFTGENHYLPRYCRSLLRSFSKIQITPSALWQKIAPRDRGLFVKKEKMRT